MDEQINEYDFYVVAPKPLVVTVVINITKCVEDDDDDDDGVECT